MIQTHVGNPYQTFKDKEAICITTNGIIKKDGRAVMGRGNAQFARDTFAGIDKRLGHFLKQYGNRAFLLGPYSYNLKTLHLLSFPTKHNWRDKSDLQLIKKSAEEVKQIADRFSLSRIYIPAPGCSNGQLLWSDVKEMLTDLDGRFIVYSLSEEDFKK